MSTLPLSAQSEDRIRAVAHALWLEDGQPDGRAEAHWLKALEIVNAETAAAPKRKAAAPAAPKKLAAAAAKKAAPRKRS